MRRRLAIISVVFFLFAEAVTAPSFAADLHVPSPYATIQDAISAAIDGDTIHVAPGNYFGPFDFSGKDVHILATDGPAQTILSNEGLGSVVTFQSGETRNAILEGFQITGGSGHVVVNTLYGGGILVRASAPTIRANIIVSNTAELGGGIACIEGADPLIRDNEIHLNGTTHGNSMPAVGGGVYIEGSSPIIEDNVIDDNQAKTFGGGIASEAGSFATIRRNRFISNRAGTGASMGGAIGCRGMSSVVIAHNEFSSNAADVGAGLFVGNGATANVRENTFEKNITSIVGGGIALIGDVGSIVENNILTKNRAAQGLGIYTQESDAKIVANTISFHNNANASGAGIACAHSSRVQIIGNTISENSANVGAGIWVVEDSDVEIERNRILRNVSIREGAGLYVHNAAATIVGNHIVANGTRRSGGAGVFLSLSNSILASNTIAANAASAPPEEAAGGGVYMFDSTVEIVNCILWDNVADVSSQIWRFAGSLNVHDSIVQGGWPGEGNLEYDPRFVDLGAADTHLRIDSPCIDRGNNAASRIPATDADGDPRTIDGDGDQQAIIDIGADEMRPEIAARYGSVHAYAGYLARVLRVNGESGDHERVVTLPKRTPLTFSMLAPPAGPETARFVLYAWPTEPDAVTVSVQPHGLGVSGLPTPLNSGTSNQPRTIWNNMGYRQRLGRPDLDSSPAPSTIFERPDGIGYEVTFTLQGFIEDLASEADGPISVTNAVVVRVVD